MSKTKDEGNSYRSILKSTSIFGGVQIYQILITLVRGKFVAMLLGAAGMGINALFNSLALTITQFSSLGLNLAIVKEVAVRKDDPASMAHAYDVARKMVSVTALTGALICFFFSSWLSRLTFGSEGYSTQFMLLSLMIFLTISGNGYLSVLQGMRELKRISYATLAGASAGLLVGVPLYYFFSTDGIVPAMVAVALTTWICYRRSAAVAMRHSLRESGHPRRFVWQEAKPLIRHLVVLGLLLMTNELMGSLVNYLTNLYVRHSGHLENVGLYQAAYSLTNQYAGVVFTAMLLDFFPRLSAAASDNRKMAEIVNRQMEIVAYIATPLISILILSSPLVIRLLLTDNFLSIIPLMRWMGVGVLIKALMFPLGYITFAKDNRKVFFWMEGIGFNIFTLLLNCICYRLHGLIGLSYALVIDCSVTIVVYCIVNRILYGYRLNRRAFLNSLLAVAIAFAVFGAAFISHTLLSYALMGIIVLFSVVYSVINLRRCLGKPADTQETSES